MNTVTEWLCKQEKNALAVQLELIIIQVHGNVGSTYSSIGNNNISNIIQVSLNVILCILVQYSEWLVCRHESWQKSQCWNFLVSTALDQR